MCNEEPGGGAKAMTLEERKEAADRLLRDIDLAEKFGFSKVVEAEEQKLQPESWNVQILQRGNSPFMESVFERDMWEEWLPFYYSDARRRWGPSSGEPANFSTYEDKLPGEVCVLIAENLAAVSADGDRPAFVVRSNGWGEGALFGLYPFEGHGPALIDLLARWAPKDIELLSLEDIRRVLQARAGREKRTHKIPWIAAVGLLALVALFSLLFYAGATTGKPYWFYAAVGLLVVGTIGMFSSLFRYRDAPEKKLARRDKKFIPFLPYAQSSGVTM